MSKEILLSIPDDVYSQIQIHAEKTKQPLDTFILNILANSVESEDVNKSVNQVTSLPDSNVEREKAAYFSMHKNLWRKFPGQHVAIYKGVLVDHDADGHALSKRIYKRYPDEFVLIRQVEKEPEPVLHVRSPRFEASP